MPVDGKKISQILPKFMEVKHQNITLIHKSKSGKIFTIIFSVNKFRKKYRDSLVPYKNTSSLIGAFNVYSFIKIFVEK